MLRVSAVAGNVFKDSQIAKKYRHAKSTGACEILPLSRIEMERTRIRRRTDLGTDVGMILESGSRLRHGDVLAAKKFIVVKQLPEKVVSLSLPGRESYAVRTAALIGHAIGNRHRPIAFSRGSISFPVQDLSEVETFRKSFPNGIKFKVLEKVFLPDVEVHSH